MTPCGQLTRSSAATWLRPMGCRISSTHLAVSPACTLRNVGQLRPNEISSIRRSVYGRPCPSNSSGNGGSSHVATVTRSTLPDPAGFALGLTPCCAYRVVVGRGLHCALGIHSLSRTSTAHIENCRSLRTNSPETYVAPGLSWDSSDRKVISSGSTEAPHRVTRACWRWVRRCPRTAREPRRVCVGHASVVDLHVHQSRGGPSPAPCRPLLRRPGFRESAPAPPAGRRWRMGLHVDGLAGQPMHRTGDD